MTYYTRILSLSVLALAGTLTLALPVSAQNGRPLAFGKNGMGCCGLTNSGANWSESTD